MEKSFLSLNIENLGYSYSHLTSIPITAKVEETSLIPSDIVQTIKDKIKNSEKHTTFKKGDVLYISPKATVPRDKLKTFCLKEGITVTRDPKKATHIIVHDKLQDVLLGYDDYVTIKNSDIQQFLSNSIYDLTEVSKINQDLSQYPSDSLIYVGGRYNWRLRREILNSHTYSPSDCYLYKIKDNSYKVLAETIHASLKVYSEEALIQVINADSVIINEEVYEQLCNLFDSSDLDNTILAMEIMANCQYSESLPRLLILFYKYYYKMDNSHTKTHVNFKSLLKYLNIQSLRYRLTVDDCYNILINHNAVNEENVEVLSNFMLSELSFGRYASFKINEITLSDVLSDKLGKVVTYKLHE